MSNPLRILKALDQHLTLLGSLVIGAFVHADFPGKRERPRDKQQQTQRLLASREWNDTGPPLFP
jgi:hypothetical protein